MKNQFEQHLKQSLEKFEVKYDPAHWADMDKRLDRLQGRRSFPAGKVLGIAAGVVAIAGLVYFFSTDNAENKDIPKANTTAQNIAAGNQVKENGTQQTELPKPASGNQQPATGISDNSKKEKTISDNKLSENKTVSPGKTEAPANTASETKNPNQPVQQVTPSEVQPVAAGSLNASFHADQKICAGSPAKFGADNADITCTCHWDFGDGKTSGESSPSHVYQKAGTYAVKLRLTSVKAKTSDEQKIAVVVNPAPVIEMNSSIPDETNPSLVNFEAKDGSVKEWIWDFGDGQRSNEQNPSHPYSKTGTYYTSVSATNNFGCTSSSPKIPVSIENIFPLAPNAFSPDGNGLNDTWMPASFVNGDYNFTLTIFDKNGNVVYKTSDKNQAWDGANAKPGDSFSWKSTAKDKNGKTFINNGSIVITK